MKFIDCLKRFNSKERFYLVGQALSDHMLAPSSDFRRKLAELLDLCVPRGAFAATDYHLDWLYASLQIAADRTANFGPRLVYSNKEEHVKGTAEDVDCLIVFEAGRGHHVILVEAKGVGGWTNKQMKSKIGRLRGFFGEGGKKWSGVTPHLVLMSPKPPSEKLQTSGWPGWTKDAHGRPYWLRLAMPSDLKKIERCDACGTRGRQGGSWTVSGREE